MITKNIQAAESLLKKHNLSLDMFYAVTLYTDEIKLQGYKSSLKELSVLGDFIEDDDNNRFLRLHIRYNFDCKIDITLT